MKSSACEQGEASAPPELWRIEMNRLQEHLAACRRQLEEWEAIFAHAADALLVLESDGRIIEANPAATAILGYSRNELLHLSPWAFVTGTTREEILGTIRKMPLGTNLSLQQTFRCKSGELKLIDLVLTRFHRGGQERIIVSCRDVTGHKNSQADLRAAKAQSKLDLGNEVVFTVILHDITERQQAAQTLQASEKFARGQAEALTRTLDALVREASPDRLVEHVLRTITMQLEAHSSSVWLKDTDSGMMVFEFALDDDGFKTKRDANFAACSPTLNIEAVWPWPEVFRTGKPSVLEDIRLGPDFPCREHVLAQGVITIIIVPMLIAGQVAGVIGIRFKQKREFRSEEIALAQALANQAMLAMQLTRLLAQSRESAVMAERNRLARDIHDTLAQGFTGVIVQLEAAADADSKGLAKEAKVHLHRAGELARESLKEARQSVRALRPQALEAKNLCEALEDLTRKLTMGTSMRAEFTVKGQWQPLPAEWEENILRIGQEVVTNVVRHSQASHFTTRMVFDTQEIRLEIKDNGRGFDPSAKHDGFGLVGMRERAETMGGQLAIQSGMGSGTAITFTLPLTNISPPLTS